MKRTLPFRRTLSAPCALLGILLGLFLGPQTGRPMGQLGASGTGSREGHALSQIELEVRRLGSDCGPQLLKQWAVLALEGEEWVIAEVAAERAAARDPSLEGFREFVLGRTAFARAVRFAALWERPEGGAPAFDGAVAHGSRSARHFEDAALAEGDWPAACRNAERVHRWLADLRKKKDAQDQKGGRRDPPPDPKDAPESEPGTDASRRLPPVAVATEVLDSALTPEQIRRLLDLLAEKDRAKLRMRREVRSGMALRGGRDW